MRITVTGSAGYVGSALCNWLEAKGHTVQRADVVQVIDIATTQGRMQVATWAPELVYNLAAIVGEPESRKDPVRARLVNYDAAVLLREAVEKAAFVQASTASVLDKNISRESTPYAWSKQKAEQSLSLYPKTLIFRFATVFGFNGLGKMRWELPVNRMCRDAVVHGVISVKGPELMRPWIGHSMLVQTLVDALGWADCEYPDPVPVCEANTSLQLVAELVNVSVKGSRIDLEPAGEDARDYTMPAMVQGMGLYRGIRTMVAQVRKEIEG